MERYFGEATPKLGFGLMRLPKKASGCIACGQCERACPQQIKVIERLKDCAGVFEK